MKSISLLLLTVCHLAADWTPPPFDLTTTNTSNTPQIAVNAAGQAVAIWQYLETMMPNNYTQIQAAVYDGTTWTPFNLTPLVHTANPVQNPQVGIDADGNAIAVWEGPQGPTPATIIQAGIYDVSMGTWSVVDLTLAMSTDLVSLPQIAVNPSSQTLIVWQSNDNVPEPMTTTEIQGRAYSGGASGTWTPDLASAPTTIATSMGADVVTKPQVAINNSGDGVAVWQLGGSTAAINIEAATYNGISVTTTAITAVTAPDAATTPLAVIDSMGNATAIWKEGSGINTFLRSATLPSSTTTWTTPIYITPIRPGGLIETSPDLTIDPSGNVFAVWEQDFLGNQSIITAILPFGVNVWNTTNALAFAPGLTAATTPEISINDSGEAVVVWQYGNNIQARTYSGGLSGTWTPSLLDLPTDVTTATAPQIANIPQVGIDSDGNAIAVWQLTDTSPPAIIQTEGYHPAPTPPSNFTGRIIKNNFLTQTDIIDLLSWDPSADPTTVSYQILLGDEVLATIPASGPFTASIHNRTKNTYTYALVSLNAEGVASTPIYLTVTP